jgi:CrcB protein
VSVWAWVLVAVLGGSGSVARFLVDGLVSERAAGVFPWGTLLVNMSGAALLGLLVGAAVTGDTRILFGTATLGSYTTLSTWVLETHRLAQDDQLKVAAANLGGSLVVGYAALALGHVIGAAL